MVTSPVLDVPVELKDDVVVLEVPLPGPTELEQRLTLALPCAHK